jgi:hypothetical protein
MFRLMALGLVEVALLAGAFGLGRAMAPPAAVAPLSELSVRPIGRTVPTGCGVTGDLAGDANPADVARALCPSR